eukprot:scaffold942_cov260-Pinguiococcus_pyrenoidosus.AAC.12
MVSLEPDRLCGPADRCADLCLRLGAVLRGCRFFKTNLKDADFTGADLTGVAMEQVRCLRPLRCHFEERSGMRLDDAESNLLTQAQLEGTNLGDAVLEGVYFTGATLDQAGNIKGSFKDGLQHLRTTFRAGSLAAVSEEAAQASGEGTLVARRSFFRAG